jgi:hypothetical protein
MLSMPILNGRIVKWILALSEFELKFESAKAIKGQIIADFITEHRDPSIDFALGFINFCRVKLLLGLYFLMGHHVVKVGSRDSADFA